MALRTLPSRIKATEPRVRFLSTEGGANAKHYQSQAHRLWAAAVKRRDGYACRECGASGPDVRLIADHIRELADGGDMLDVRNGFTLCVACHNRKTARARAQRNER